MLRVIMGCARVGVVYIKRVREWRWKGEVMFWRGCATQATVESKHQFYKKVTVAKEEGWEGITF